MTTTLHLPVFFSAATALVEGEAHHHLFKVKRLQTGERLRVIDGAGHARWAEIVGIDKRAARLALGEPAPANEPALAVELFVAAAKPERLAWLVEKATELGVAAVHFIAAVEQAGRSAVPGLALAGGVGEELARATADGVTTAVLDAAGPGARPAIPAGKRCGLFVGPEGGWSPAERDRFRELSTPSWSLGPTVLRVETAAVVAAGCVLCGGGLSR